MPTIQRAGTPPSAAQRKYLKERIEEISRNARSKRYSLQSLDEKHEPRDIVAARKRIERYNQKRAEQNKDVIKRLKLDKDHVETAQAIARKAMLFGTAEQALAAVEEFHKKYPFDDE
jgi:cell division septum initiation protein DivIVA